MLERGYWTIGRVRRAPLRLHWTAPIGLLVVGAGSPPACAGLFFSLLVHELGHAFVVWRFRLSVLSIDIHGLGGACRWAGSATDVQRAMIAWGGVLAQGVLIAACEIVARLGLASRSPFLGDMLSFMTALNLVIIALNLLPIRPLDGAEAWPLFRFRNLARFGRRTTLHARKASVKREIAKLVKPSAAPEQKKRKPSSWDLN